MKRLLQIATLAAILTANLVWAVDDVPQPWQGGTGCESTDTIAGLPTSPLDGTICGVTNGSIAAGNCSTTGTDHIICYYDSAGAAWRPLARGGGGSFLLLDASNDPLTGELTITQGAANTTPSLTAQNTTDNAIDTIVRLKGPDRATSANNDRIKLIFAQEDGSGTIDDQCEIVSRITDKSSGLEDSQLDFTCASSGSMTNRQMLIGSDAGLGTPIVTIDPDSIGTDFRANSDLVDGALCFDGAGNGLLALGDRQGSVARCNAGGSTTHGSLTGSLIHLLIWENEDAIMVIEADDNDSTEGDNPEIHFVQDGEAQEATVAMEGTAGTKYTNSTDNAFYIEAGVTGSQNIELANNNTMRLRVTTTEVDVAAGGSTDIAAVGGLMSNTNTAVANVGTSDPDDLVTYSIPASTLATTGDLIVFEADFTFAANGNSKEFRIVYGATPVTVITSGAQAQSGGSCRIRGYISRTGTNTEDISASMVCDNANLFTYNSNFTTATETLTNALTLKGQSVTSTNDGDVQMENLRVWFYPAQS